MISDVLSDAIDEIRQYLDDPEWEDVYPHGPFRQKLEDVLRQMDELRAILDTPPSS